jgi:hypothetical protein
MKTKTNRKTPAIRRYSPDLAPSAPLEPDNPESAINEHSAANDHLVITGFCGLGIPASDIQPRVNVLTFRKWREAGRQVKRGEHGIKIKGRSGHLTVFHVSQTERVKAVAVAPQTPPPSIPDPQPVPQPTRRLPAWLRRSASEVRSSALVPA